MESHFSLQGLHQTGWLVASVLALGLSGACVWILYRYERQLITRTVGWWLVSLRLSVLFLVFFILLQPVVSWSLSETERGRVAVAIDISESMQTRDEHASLAEQLRWARSLGMIGGVGNREQIDRWIQEAERGEEPDWVTEEEQSDPERRERLARSRRENIDAVLESLKSMTRLELTERLLTNASTPLLKELSELHVVDLQLFAGEAEGISPETLEPSLETPPYQLNMQSSDLNSALESASADLEDSPLSAVLLLTDGRDNSDVGPLNSSIHLGNRGIPVYPIMIGSESRPRDLSISAVEYPQTAFKDDQTVVTATINTSGFEGQELDVELWSGEGEPVRQTIQAEGRSTSVEFELDSSAVGRREYRLFLPIQNEETRDDNNEKTFAMTVVDDTVRALLLEQEARWEFRFIDNALVRDDRVEIDKVVFDQPFLGVLEETFFPQTLSLPANDSDESISPFAEKDLVILGDVGPEHLNARFFTLLEEFVSEAGGTLVITAGKNSMPRAFQDENLAKLLPVRNPEPFNVRTSQGTRSPRERGFHLTLSPEGEAEPFLQFDADPVRNREIWNELPGFNWCLFGEARPGATVLASARKTKEFPQLNDTDRSAIIVHQYYGFGQVLWIGVDSTWRWRHRKGDAYHHRFWGQLARWAAKNRSSAGNDFVRFGPVQTDLAQGEDAVIKARYLQQYLRKFPRLKSEVEVYRLSDDDRRELFTTVGLEPNAVRPLSHEGRVVGLPAGRYRLKLLIAGADPQTEALEAPLYVQPQATLELSDFSANRDLLEQMANLSNGRFYLPDQIPELLDNLQQSEGERVVREDVELWDQWWMMLLVFGLMTTEWVTRKLNGLP